MSIDQKEQRTGRIRHAVRCRLPGYRLAFNKRGARQGQVYANIIAAQSEEVWGVAYLCDPAALREMDRLEGVAGGHYRHVEISVVAEDGQQLAAVSYVAGPKFIGPEGRPGDTYLGKIIEGARQHGLPERYVRDLEERALSKS
jgi:gamma-glutamylcyclotransferase (GGCT)/AIG2-like uncharacterized protein YtfP